MYKYKDFIIHKRKYMEQIKKDAIDIGIEIDNFTTISIFKDNILIKNISYANTSLKYVFFDMIIILNTNFQKKLNIDVVIIRDDTTPKKIILNEEINFININSICKDVKDICNLYGDIQVNDSNFTFNILQDKDGK